MRLLWLPQVLRRWGLVVVEQPGWTQRGRDFPGRPSVVVGHHTATSLRAPGDFPTLRLLIDGRSDLPGPLCQIGLSRSGVAHVIAAGKANHAGVGSWSGCTSSALTVGIEVEHPGTGGWGVQQLDAFDRVAAALLDGLGLPADRYCGHREWATPAGRKVDPGGVNLPAQRLRLRALLAARPTTPAPAPVSEEDDAMRYRAIRRDPDGAIALVAPGFFRHVDGEGLAANVAGGLVANPDGDEVNAREWDVIRAIALGSDRVT